MEVSKLWEQIHDLEFRTGLLGSRVSRQEKALDANDQYIRASEIYIPHDDEAERGVIGCALLLPNERVFKKLWDKAFYDEYHAWIWGRLSWANKTRTNGIETLWYAGGPEYARRKFGANLARDLSKLMDVFAHNLWWYACRVEGAYRHRKLIAETVGKLARLQEQAKAAERRWWDTGKIFPGEHLK